jgi:16S rRNA (guanine(966)-N(2))-methyltransferase RsmD
MLREAVFNICQNEVEGARFLDLFAGSGAMGFEALSRGASQVVFVESNKTALSCIQKNRALLEAQSKTDLIPLPAKKAIELLVKKGALFDLIYIDPPYDTSLSFLGSLLPLLAPGATLFIEERYDPKGKGLPSVPPSLILKKSRRFGIALLHQYHL